MVSAAAEQLPVTEPLSAPPQHRPCYPCGAGLVLVGLTGQQERRAPKHCCVRAPESFGVSNSAAYDFPKKASITYAFCICSD